MNYSNDFGIFCDWLQIHVKTSDNFLEIENPYYSFRRSGQSKIWRNIYEIKNSAAGNVVAHYCTDAQECIMKKNHGVLKIENNQLYIHESLKAFTERFLERLNFKFVSITRLDIAYDFQKFHMNLNPMLFIKRYAEHKTIRVGGSRGVSGLLFKQHTRYHDFQTMYFGTKKSDLQVKLYNKTNELATKEKPWINQRYKEIFPHMNAANIPVWRLEFSVYSLSNAMLFDPWDQSETKYNSLDVLEDKNLYGIFQGLFKKHFEFRTCGKEKRVARMKPLSLINFDITYVKKLVKQNELIKMSNKADRSLLKDLNDIATGTDKNICDDAKKIADKAFIDLSKVMEISRSPRIKSDTEFLQRLRKYVSSSRAAKVCVSRLNKTTIGKGDYDENYIDASKEIIAKFVSEHALQDFANKKGIDYKGRFENYVADVEQFYKVSANHEKLDREFKEMKRQQTFINESSFIKIN